MLNAQEFEVMDKLRVALVKVYTAVPGEGACTREACAKLKERLEDAVFVIDQLETWMVGDGMDLQVAQDYIDMFRDEIDERRCRECKWFIDSYKTGPKCDECRGASMLERGDE